MEIIEDILEKVENYLLKDEYIELSKLMSQSKYLKLWQIVYNLDGNVVFQLVNESLTRFGNQNHNELQDVINQCTSKSKLYQIMTSDCVIITRIFGMIYWINLLFGQFNQFVFQAKTQMSIIQYAFVQSIQKVFQPIGKKLSRAIIDHLFTLKNCPHAMNGRLNSNMRFILLFHDRTFTESTKVLQNKITKKFILQFEANSRCNLSLEGMNIAQKAEKQNTMKINKYNEIVQKLSKQDRQLILGSGGDVSQEAKDYGQDILFGYTKQINDLINTGNIYEESDENSYEDCVNWMKMKDSSASNQSIGLQILKVFVARLKYQFESIKENSYASMITAIDSIEQEVFEWTHMIDYYFIKNSIQLAQFIQEKAILDYFPILLKNKDIGLHEAVKNHRFESLIRLYQFSCNDNQAISQLAQSLSEFTTEKLQDIEVSSAEIIKEYSMDRQNEDKIIQILQDTLTYDESLNVKQFQQKWWNKISELLDQLVKINDECFYKNNTIKVAFDGSFQQQLCHSDFFFDYFEDQCHLKLIEMKDKVEKDDSKQRQIEKQTIEGCNDNNNNNIDILLKLVPASERFLENYKKRLAIRLLHQLSNIQDEKDMLSKIEGIAGKGYFVKTMQNMIEDLDKNVVIRKDFIHSLEEEAEQDVEEESKQEQDQGKVKENQKNDAVENKNSVEFHGEEKDYQDFIIHMKSIEGDIMNQQRDKNQTWKIFFSVLDSQELPSNNSDCFQVSKEKSKESKIIQDREEEQNDSINLEIHNQDEMIQVNYSRIN